MTGYALELAREYPVGPDVLFAAIGAGSLFIARGAMPSSIVAEFREGGRFTFERPDGGRVSGVFTRVVPGQLVEIRWAGMTASLRFEPTALGSRLVLSHVDIPSGELREAYEDGWRDGLRHLVLPPLFPEERSATADEREVLSAFLAYQRSVMTGKLNGLSEADARRRIVPSDTTPIALVRHVSFVEREWFGAYLGGQPVEVRPEDRDGWWVPSDATVASVIADYVAACAESDRIAAPLRLDHHVAHPRLGRVSLRWIYTHLIEETARHAGHLDILRELIDGVTGVDV
jgi:uncharacterized protein YndB with AHSA1/START domain